MTLLAECHFNLALLEHERKRFPEAIASYTAAIAAHEALGKGLFVDAKYNLKVHLGLLFVIELF